MDSRSLNVMPPAVTISPPFGGRANAETVRSTSDGTLRLTGLTSTPREGATDWITANWPMPAITDGSQRTAARVTLGAICFSNSSHLPLKLYSNCKKPVAFPPGCDRLSTKPDPTGSGTTTNTIGTVRVVLINCSTAPEPDVRITSGVSATNSAAYLRARSASPWPKRASICTLRPSVQPNCSSPCRNAAQKAFTSESSTAPPLDSTPIRRMRSPCSARAASGQAVAAPTMLLMKSRRRIA